MILGGVAIKETIVDPSAHDEGLAAGYWTKIMTPKRRFFDVDFCGLWRYRELVALFVWRDFKAAYKQTVLGPAWFFISPVLTALVFSVVFGEIARIPTDGTPPFLFFLCGTTCWGLFARCLLGTSGVFAANAELFGKVFFPRLAIPVATLLSSCVTFLIQLAILLGFLVYFKARGAPITAGQWTLVVPLLALQAGILGMAVGILVSSLTTKYRDLNHFINFAVQLWMYATPVVYPLSQVPDRYAFFFLLNPMASIVEGFRKGLLGIGSVTPSTIVVSLFVSLVLLAAGLGLFAKTENTFLDRI